jgi:hypothetical protein
MPKGIGGGNGGLFCLTSSLIYYGETKGETLVLSFPKLD